MNTRAIGVFDSGLGGLTAVRQLKRLLPGEDIIYFGDTGRVPYGSRSRQTIIRYTRQDIAFLQKKQVKAILVACGTASSVALPTLKADVKVPIIGVVEPACQRALQVSKTGRIGVIGTKSTVQSRSYETILKQNNENITVLTKACPLLVPLVEEGRFAKDDKITALVIEEYLEEMKRAEIDTLILGCTHYPLLEELITKFMGADVFLVSPGAEAAESLRDRLQEQNIMQQAKHIGRAQYYVSDGPESFAAYASMFMGEPVAGEVNMVEIDQYDR